MPFIELRLQADSEQYDNNADVRAIAERVAREVSDRDDVYSCEIQECPSLTFKRGEVGD